MRRLAYILIALCMAFTVGCDSSSSNSASSALLETTCTVQRVNFGSFGPGQLQVYECSGNKRIVFMDYTTASRQRGSCSGNTEVTNPIDIKIGDVLIVRYEQQNVNYTQNPPTFQASVIEAYAPECINAHAQGVDPSHSDGCGTCEFFR